jgi:GNAT superfamily N-acetyltransferase
MDVTTRPAIHDDYDAVAAFTRGTFPGIGGDYVPRIYHDWIEGEDRLTLVAEVEGEVVGIAQFVLLSEWEAWGQGLRVHPDYRGQSVALTLAHDLFGWAREQGATVARVMVFSWNEAGLGNARAVGYDPVTEFRWAHPEPRGTDPDFAVTSDPDAAWRYWTDSDAREYLRGLALDFDETWALSVLTRDGLVHAADEEGLFVVQDDGTVGMGFRIRECERENDDGETETWAEYGVGAWDSVAAAESLFAAIGDDAARLGADRTRVLIPETPRHVSDAVFVHAGVADDPDFVFAADLTGEYREG